MTNLSNYFPGVEMKDVYTPTSVVYSGSTAYYLDSAYTASADNVYTLVFQFKCDAFTGNTLYRTIYIWGGASAGKQRVGVACISDDYTTDANIAGCLQFYVENSAGTNIAKIMSEPKWFDGNAHTVFFTYDGTAGTVQLIIDGEDADDTGNASRVLTTGTMKDGINSDAVVAAGWASSGNYFIGEIGYLGYADVDGLDWTDFMWPDGRPKKIDEVNWTQWGGVQPTYWNEFGKMNENKGSGGNMAQTGTLTLSDEEIVRAGVVPGMMLPGESIALKLNNYMEMRESGTGNRVDSHGELVLLDNGGTGVTQATGVNIGLATDFQNTTSAAAGVSNLTQAAETQLETAQGCFGVGCWIEPRNLDIGHQLIGRVDNVSAAVNGWALMIDASDKLSMTVVTGNVDYTATWPVAVDTSSTYFVWANYNKYTPFANGGLVSISVNGKPFVSTAVPGGIDNDGDTINVGRRTYAGSKYYYCGLMNRLIYTRAPLALAEALWLYNNGLGRSYGAIMAYAP